MSMNEIKSALEDFGMSRNEIKVYVFLLTHGRESAGVVAKETQMDRSACYEALKRLLKRGIIKYSLESKTRYFESEEPSLLIDMLNEKQEKLKQVIGEMKEVYKKEKQDSSIKLYRGYNGIKTVFLDIIREGKNYCVLDSSGQFVKRMPNFAPHFIKLLEKNKIKVRHIVRKDIDIHPSKTTEVKFFTKKIPLTNGNTTIYGNKLAIFLWNEIPEAIVIQHKPTSELYQDYFEMLWKHSLK
jgi:HTH-type transcriptional regulator, sugar sensing transcriptional regulator